MASAENETISLQILLTLTLVTNNHTKDYCSIFLNENLLYWMIISLPEDNCPACEQLSHTFQGKQFCAVFMSSCTNKILSNELVKGIESW